MCGILGIWRFDDVGVDVQKVVGAANCIQHRGPDDEGYLLADTTVNQAALFGGLGSHPALQLPDIFSASQSYNLAFGFRRLAILDLSPAGHQPMTTTPETGVWIVFNGEIYNYIELREELRQYNHTFRTDGDAEVILAAYAQWGTACVEKFNGMWAFAIWDGPQRHLFCSRDRFGIKPFYYSLTEQHFAFASEIKGLLNLLNDPVQVNDEIVYDYLAAGLVSHNQHTFFKNVTQLLPAHSLVIHNDQVAIRRYWNIDPTDVRPTPDAQAAKEFYTLFEDSIRLHLRSDVPVGTCLSGGLDSSSIVTMANRLMFSEQVVDPALIGLRQKTFSSCFDDKRFDERTYVDAVLEVTGAEANYIFPSPNKLLSDLESIIWHQDEPFGSTSIFAQWCVMERAAQRKVKVLLDGQGADELLAGYHSYFDHYWGSLLRAGRLFRLQNEIEAYTKIHKDSPSNPLLRMMKPFVPSMFQTIGRRLFPSSTRFSANALEALSPDFLARYSERPVYTGPYWKGDAFQNALYNAFVYGSLPGLLRYEDRNSMAHSIEARVPFLDHRLVEFVFRLPTEQKIRGAVTKFVLRNALKGVLPESVRLRMDKMGFVTPEGTWLTGELKTLMNDLLLSEKFSARGYFHLPTVRKLLNEHNTGTQDLSFVAWRWANLELWFRRFVDTW